MTAEPIPSEPDAGERFPACDNCGARLAGRYCHECGEDSAPPVRSMRSLAEDFFDSVLSYTSHMPVTYWAMFVRPLALLDALRRGDSRRFLPPFKLYVTATVIFFLFLGVSGVTILQAKSMPPRDGGAPKVVLNRAGDVERMEGIRMEERWLHPRSTAPRDAEVVAALDEAIRQPGIEPATRSILMFFRSVASDPSDVNSEISAWAPRALWLMMPLYALLLWPFYARGRLLSEHVIFALWAHTLIFLLLVAGALWNMAGLGYGLGLAALAYQAYLTVGLRGYYGSSWLGAAVKGAAHSLIYLGLLWLPLTLGFFFWQALKHLPPSYLE